MSSRIVKPTLAVNVTTRDSADRLARLLREVAGFADEIIVGVDDGSTDDTLGVALDGANVVYRFSHTGQSAPARMLVFEHTRCDWLLVLDDDEGVDTELVELLPELLADDRYASWQLPRKWLVNSSLDEYAAMPPWYPDYQLRLLRADSRIAWKPMEIHTGMRVMGPMGWADRGAILHYEPLLLDEEQRRAKNEFYRERGASEAHDEFYSARPSGNAALESPPYDGGTPKANPWPGRLVLGVVDLDSRPRLPPWNADVTVSMPTTARAGELFLALAEVRNTGGLNWVPQGTSLHWPVLNLSYRVRHADGSLTDPPGERTCVPGYVAPGEAARFICRVVAPDEPGDYTLEWQMLSEFECWFTDCGAEPACAPLNVV